MKSVRPTGSNFIGERPYITGQAMSLDLNRLLEDSDTSEPTWDGSDRNTATVAGHKLRKLPPEIRRQLKCVLSPTDPLRDEFREHIELVAEKNSQTRTSMDSSLIRASIATGRSDGTALSRFWRGASSQRSSSAGRQATHEAVQKIELLSSLEEQIDGAIERGDVDLLHTSRDELIDTAEAIYWILEGQLGCAEFDPECIAEEKRISLGDARSRFVYRNKSGPIARLAQRNLAHFSAGELIGTVTLPNQNHSIPYYYTITPTHLVRISKKALALWVRDPNFAALLADHEKNESLRFSQGRGVNGIVIDHYIRHGASVATTLRIVDLDKCNWCRQCEVACEERHGISRFSINGRALGVVGFADCCRTCVDQRCVDACTYDAIAFDRIRKEVIIKEDTCTGCSMCAENCPYDAIKLHPLAQNPRFQAHLEAKGALRYGPKAARRLPLFRMAAKCDHCADFADQACITHCPTEALVEVRPEEIFFHEHEVLLRSPSVPAKAAAASGLINPQQFMDGGTLTGHGRRGVARKMRVPWLWWLSIPPMLLIIIEITLRHVWPRASFLAQYLIYLRGEDVATATYFANHNYHAGDKLSLALGILGTSLMVSAAFYSVFLRLLPMSPAGSPNTNRATNEVGWRQRLIAQSRRLLGAFGYHIWAGTVGAAAVGLHTAFTLHSSGSLAGMVSTAVFWLTVAIVLSGVVGRLMSVKGNASIGQAKLRAEALRDRLTPLRVEHPGMRPADRYCEGLVAGYERHAQASFGTLVLPLLKDEAVRMFRGLLLYLLLSGVKDARARREIAKSLAQLTYLQRQVLFLPRLQGRGSAWRLLHGIATCAFLLMVVLHVLTSSR